MRVYAAPSSTIRLGHAIKLSCVHNQVDEKNISSVSWQDAKSPGNEVGQDDLNPVL